MPQYFVAYYTWIHISSLSGDSQHNLQVYNLNSFVSLCKQHTFLVVYIKTSVSIRNYANKYVHTTVIHQSVHQYIVHQCASTYLIWIYVYRFVRIYNSIAFIRLCKQHVVVLVYIQTSVNVQNYIDTCIHVVVHTCIHTYVHIYV